jgi:hypothetical protein
VKENCEKENSCKIVVEKSESKKRFWTLGGYNKILYQTHLEGLWDDRVG